MMTTIGIKEKNKKLKTPCTFRITMLQYTPEREWWSWFEVLKMGGMWLAKVARRGEISNAISKNFVGYCVGCEHL